MPGTVADVHPDFIVITFDIRATDGTARAFILRKIRTVGGQMWTQSQYYMPYHEQTVKDILEFAKVHDTVNLIITTPAYPSEQVEMLCNKYEHDFRQQFKDANEELKRTELMITGELLNIDDNGKEMPYTPKQIKQRLSGISYLISQLEEALARRMRLEGQDEKKAKMFEETAFNLRKIQTYCNTLEHSNKRKLEAMAATATPSTS